MELCIFLNVVLCKVNFKYFQMVLRLPWEEVTSFVWNLFKERKGKEVNMFIKLNECFKKQKLVACSPDFRASK